MANELSQQSLSNIIDNLKQQASEEKMKAAVLNQYNKKDVNLSFSNLPTPSISADQVLVKSLAAGVNPVDNMITKGEVKLIIPYHLPIVLVMSSLVRSSIWAPTLKDSKKATASLPGYRLITLAPLRNLRPSTVKQLPRSQPTFPMRRLPRFR